ALVRHQARERETEQERRRQVYNDLINLGTADDVATYARQCLEDPAAAPALTRLADYLESSRSSALAAHLAVRLEKADRSRLEGFLLADGSAASIRTLEALAYDGLWPELLASEERHWAAG